MLGYDVNQQTITTLCATPSALPTGFVEVPAIAWDETGDGNEIMWNTPPLDPCTDGNVVNAECWEMLNMSEYVEWWWPVFKDHCDGQPFTECFFIAMTDMAPTNCTVIEDSCQKPDWAHFKNQWNGVRNFYLAYTIWRMNDFFYTYSLALAAAEATAGLMIGNIVQITDPIKTTNVALDDVLEALSVGLAFLPGVTGIFGKAVMTAAQQTPGVAHFMFPVGTMNNQLEEMQNISGGLGKAVKQLGKNLATALAGIMGNSTYFASMASTGAFSDDSSFNANDISNGVLQGLMAFVISQAYQSRGIVLTRQLNTSVAELNTNGTKLN